MFPDGEVYDENETKICETGGEQCLFAYLDSLVPQEYVYEIDGYMFTFVVDPSGVVTVKETG